MILYMLAMFEVNDIKFHHNFDSILDLLQKPLNLILNIVSK